MESKRAAIARARIQTATMGESMTRQHGCGEDNHPLNVLFEIMPFSLFFFFLCYTFYAYLCTTIYGFIVFFVVAAISGSPPLINTLTPTTLTPHILPLSAISAEKASLSTFHIAYIIMHMYIPCTGYFLIFLLFSNTFQE